jgi:hypothetical protein
MIIILLVNYCNLNVIDLVSVSLTTWIKYLRPWSDIVWLFSLGTLLKLVSCQFLNGNSFDSEWLQKDVMIHMCMSGNRDMREGTLS